MKNRREIMIIKIMEISFEYKNASVMPREARGMNNP